MTILCGTDFSDQALDAERAAASLTRATGQTLALVHVLSGFASKEALSTAQTTLHEHAEALRQSATLDVAEHIERGATAEQIIGISHDIDAELIVLSSLGTKKPGRWRLGSVADRVAQRCSRPVLITRESASLESWIDDGVPLRVLVAVDLNETSKHALQWALSLRELGPCDLLIARIIWPAEERPRADATHPMPLDTLPPELEATLLAELGKWAEIDPAGTEPAAIEGAEGGHLSGLQGSHEAASRMALVVRAGWGRIDAHLTQLATKLGAHLVVVGMHQRPGLSRLWQGSISRGVIHHATTNVAAVPYR